jgi:hypothetical protein
MKYFLIWACIFTFLSGNADAENLRVRLLTEVTVQAETVRLSDLLPADAEMQLQSAAETLSLGNAPQPGSLRVFTGLELRQAIAETSIDSSEIAVPQQVVVRRWGWPIEAEAVRRTLARSRVSRQLDFSQARIALPTGFSTTVPHPQFEVTALMPGEGGLGWLARMRCRERTACGCFLARIVVSDAASGRGTRPPPVVHSFFPGRLKIVSDFGPVLVHPGRLALLVIEGDGLRITEPVMPLKPARLGELVRVSDPLTHRFLVAQVSGNGKLRPGATRNEEAK